MSDDDDLPIESPLLPARGFCDCSGAILEDGARNPVIARVDSRRCSLSRPPVLASLLGGEGRGGTFKPLRKELVAREDRCRRQSFEKFKIIFTLYGRGSTDVSFGTLTSGATSTFRHRARAKKAHRQKIQKSIVYDEFAAVTELSLDHSSRSKSRGTKTDTACISTTLQRRRDGACLLNDGVHDGVVLTVNVAEQPRGRRLRGRRHSGARTWRSGCRSRGRVRHLGLGPLRALGLRRGSRGSSGGGGWRALRQSQVRPLCPGHAADRGTALEHRLSRLLARRCLLFLDLPLSFFQCKILNNKYTITYLTENKWICACTQQLQHDRNSRAASCSCCTSYAYICSRREVTCSTLCSTHTQEVWFKNRRAKCRQQQKQQQQQQQQQQDKSSRSKKLSVPAVSGNPPPGKSPSIATTPTAAAAVPATTPMSGGTAGSAASSPALMRDSPHQYKPNHGGSINSGGGSAGNASNAGLGSGVGGNSSSAAATGLLLTASTTPPSLGGTVYSSGGSSNSIWSPAVTESGGGACFPSSDHQRLSAWATPAPRRASSSATRTTPPITAIWIICRRPVISSASLRAAPRTGSTTLGQGHATRTRPRGSTTAPAGATASRGEHLDNRLLEPSSLLPMLTLQQLANFASSHLLLLLLLLSTIYSLFVFTQLYISLRIFSLLFLYHFHAADIVAAMS
ncbi:unnamed protein product [Trichogramma brassicae]|uniref:Homeobox domain-containing protein n=1 Tax=Trichogramma brassicae TaxID=86971 RepID=A0A6H5IE36_9HYME|nr:unnamed protein product [Trichogramma brassicae]